MSVTEVVPIIRVQKSLKIKCYSISHYEVVKHIQTLQNSLTTILTVMPVDRARDLMLYVTWYLMVNFQSCSVSIITSIQTSHCAPLLTTTSHLLYRSIVLSNIPVQSSIMAVILAKNTKNDHFQTLRSHLNHHTSPFIGLQSLISAKNNENYIYILQVSWWRSLVRCLSEHVVQ